VPALARNSRISGETRAGAAIPRARAATIAGVAERPWLDRRRVLKLGALGAAGAAAGWRLLPPGPSAVLAPLDELARRFVDSLDEEQRALTCVPYDHPLRQLHNRGVWGGGASVFRHFGRAQRALVADLLHAGLSPEGRERVPREQFTRFSGVHSMRILVCGEPASSPWQIVLTAAHLNLRLGGRSREGAAFGGPQVYGDQRGNGEPGLPGNLYRDQFLVAERLVSELDEGRRAAVTLDEAPVQTDIAPQGRAGSFAGLPVAELGASARERARELVERILAPYPVVDADFARECLAANGGIDALWFATYRHGEDGPIPAAQVFRLEGPAAVFHFRGHPHVHAFVNVTMDGDAPLSVGELLATNTRPRRGADVQALFEAALLAETGAEAAFFPRESVAGKLRAGAIRTGDIYALEVWQDASTVVEVRGAELGREPRARLAASGATLDPRKLYRIATSRYAAEKTDELGTFATQSPGPLLCNVLCAHLRARGFPA
jgi:hypothetical protein